MTSGLDHTTRSRRRRSLLPHTQSSAWYDAFFFFSLASRRRLSRTRRLRTRLSRRRRRRRRWRVKYALFNATVSARMPSFAFSSMTSQLNSVSANNFLVSRMRTAASLKSTSGCRINSCSHGVAISYRVEGPCLCGGAFLHVIYQLVVHGRPVSSAAPLIQHDSRRGHRHERDERVRGLLFRRREARKEVRGDAEWFGIILVVILSRRR